MVSRQSVILQNHELANQIKTERKKLRKVREKAKMDLILEVGERRMENHCHQQISLYREFTNRKNLQIRLN